ncbi:MAG: DUF2974 domain-containing protein [Clostridia bacterium]|nr:DUF2974 domain-containing protein [Clostridia bacterium]
MPQVVVDYARKYGDLSFKELPFRPNDCFVLCAALYAPIEKVVTDVFEAVPEKTFGQAIDDFYAYHDHKIEPVGLLLKDSPFRTLLVLRNFHRFADMKITGCRSVYSLENVVQFAGMTLLPADDDFMIVLFRGTDDTIAGWQEDLDILAKGDIPSHQLCVDYLEAAAAAYPDKKIIVAGHSKGAYLATYAALHCSPEVRNRLIAVYNNDGPGFNTADVIHSAEFEAIKPIYKHFVPESSLVGMLLYHDDDYEVVKSSVILPPFQHDAHTWRVNGTEPDFRPELTFIGKVNDKFFGGILPKLDAEKIAAMYEIVTTVLYAPGVETLLELGSDLGASAVKMAKSFKTVSKPAKKALVGMVGDFVSVAAKAVVTVAGEAKKVKKVPAMIKELV